MANSNTHFHKFEAFFRNNLENLPPILPLLEFIQPGNINGIDLETLIKEFQPLVEEQVKAHLAAWKADYRQKLTQLINELEQFSQKLEQLEPGSVVASQVWRDLQLTYRSTFEWIEWPVDDIPATNPWKEFKIHFHEHLQTIPEYADLVIPLDYWSIKPEDGFRVRIWKRNNQLKGKVRGAVIGVGNQARRLLRISTIDPNQAKRKFRVQSFLTFYLEIPIAQFLMAEWFQYLQQIARQLHTLHFGISEIKDDFLFLNEFETAVLHFESIDLSIPREKLESHIQTANGLIRDLDQLETEEHQRFQIREKEIFQTIRQQWNRAELSPFSKGDYGVGKIARTWDRVEAELSESRQKWTHHFEAEQGEWQGGIELALLQLQTAQLCGDTVRSIRQKIDRQLIPTFTDTLLTLRDTLKEIEGMDVGKSPQARDALAQKNRVILKSLQEEKLPLMMDTLIITQLGNVIKSYAARIRSAIEILSDGHTIFLHLDLDHPVPRSNTDYTQLLKIIISEETFLNFQQAHLLMVDESLRNIERISRGISNLDQIVEENFESIALRLSQRQGAETLNDIRKAIMAGLNQASLQVKELATQTKQLMTESEHRLLQITRSFENELQDLAETDTEQQIEAYLLLARATSKEKFKNYWRKLSKAGRTAPAEIFNATGDMLEQLRLNLFRLREITGFVADSENAEEKLTRFLNSTEEHISGLPYVYQRLFRLEPLRSDRFFTARETEIAILRQEFEQWQNGKFTATALIGERGSGISTLLNSVEEQIYKDYPIIKINLDGRTIFTVDGLFNFLKASFNESDLTADINDMDELEQKIQALETRTVFIIENLQHMFLRTPNGFDALERFLLFMSRTYHKIHWIMTCSLYSWRYFIRVINIDKYAQRKIFLDSLPQKDFEEIILRRHRATGYKLFFEVTEEIAQSRGYKKLKSNQARQDYLRNLFFEQLTELASGNISVAMLLWLRSYTEFSDDRLILPATIDFDPSFLYQLPAEELFTLAALLQHDTLNPEYHAMIFHQDIQESLLILNRMANRGYLVEAASGFRIHPFLYRSVVRVLKSANIIH